VKSTGKPAFQGWVRRRVLWSEVVPLVFQPADGALGLQLQADPIHIVALELEHLVELPFDVPAVELGAVEQHDAAGVAAGPLLRPGAPAAEDCLSAHVASQEVPDVALGEDVGIDHHGPALVAHQLRRHEAQECEGLQILVAPRPLDAVALVGLTFPRLQKGVVLGVDDADVELVGVARVAPQGVRRDQCAGDLLMIGMDKDAIVHVLISVAVA
jgi:hypothetical protein